MFTKPEDFASANKSTMEAALTLANTAFASTERFAALNLNTARTVFEESVANTKALLGAKDIQEMVSLQAAFAQPAFDKAMSYSRHVYEIATQTKDEISKVVEAQFADAQTNATTMLDQALKNAPAGSDTAIATLKSAISATNSAYASMTKTAKQMTEMAEANVAAAADATVKATGANIAKIKKAA
jgi:phasin family protein